MNNFHWMLVQWTSKLCPFHMSKIYLGYRYIFFAVVVANEISSKRGYVPPPPPPLGPGRPQNSLGFIGLMNRNEFNCDQDRKIWHTDIVCVVGVRVPSVVVELSVELAGRRKIRQCLSFIIFYRIKNADKSVIITSLTFVLCLLNRNIWHEKRKCNYLIPDYVIIDKHIIRTYTQNHTYIHTQTQSCCVLV